MDSRHAHRDRSVAGPSRALQAAVTDELLVIVAAVHQHPHPFADTAKSLVGDFDFDVILFAVLAHSKSPLGFSYAHRGSHIAVADASSFSGILPGMSDQTPSPRSTREPELTIVGVSIEAVKSMASILPEIGRMLPLVYPIYKLVQIGFARRPKLTWSITVVLLACATGGTVYLVKGFLAANEREELLKAQNETYTAQIDELNRVEASLRTLMEFVSQQKTTLSESKATLDRMREEEQQLRPIVEADRKVMEAVLAARAQQDVRRTWADPWNWFRLGIARIFSR